MDRTARRRTYFAFSTRPCACRTVISSKDALTKQASCGMAVRSGSQYARQPFQKCNGALDVVDYIPPHNVIDMKTVDALKLAGFKRIYGGPGSDEHVIWHAKDVGLKFDYSQWPYWYGRSDELLNRDKAHLMINSNPDRVVTLHWPWEWNIGLDNLERFLEEIKGVLR